MSPKIERTTSREQRQDARDMSTTKLVRFIANAVKYSDQSHGMYEAVAAELDLRVPAPVAKIKRRSPPCGTGSRPPRCGGSANYGPKGCTCPR